MDNFDNNGLNTNLQNPIQDNMGGYGFPQQPKSDLSTVSMICGIISIVVGCCCIGPVVGIVAIVTGIISLKNMTPNKGKATAGVIMGVISILLYIVSIIVNSITGGTAAMIESMMENMDACIRFFN